MARQLTRYEREAILMLHNSNRTINEICVLVDRSRYAVECVIADEKERVINYQIEQIKQATQRKASGQWVWQGAAGGVAQ